MLKDCDSGLETLTAFSRLALTPLVFTEVGRNMQFVTALTALASLVAYGYARYTWNIDARNTSNLIGLAASVAMMTDCVLFWKPSVIPIMATVLIASVINLLRTKNEISMRKYNG